MAAESIQKAIADKDAAELLKWYDNKGILSIACKAKGTTMVLFEQWIVRACATTPRPPFPMLAVGFYPRSWQSKKGSVASPSRRT
jgi:hypothetical protein